MIPNCKGCEYELQKGINWIRKSYDVCFEGLGKKKHLFIIVFDKKGKIVLS